MLYVARDRPGSQQFFFSRISRPLSMLLTQISASKNATKDKQGLNECLETETRQWD